MKKTISVLLLSLLLLTGMAYAAPAKPDTNDEPTQTVEELRDKWDALTKRQKNSIYKLFAQRGKAEIALMNEYARLGMVTEEEAEAFAERVASWLDALEQSGDLPPVYGYAKHGKHTPPEKPSLPTKPSETTQSTPEE